MLWTLRLRPTGTRRQDINTFLAAARPPTRQPGRPKTKTKTRQASSVLHYPCNRDSRRCPIIAPHLILIHSLAKGAIDHQTRALILCTPHLASCNCLTRSISSSVLTVYFQTDSRIVPWLGNMMAFIVTLNRAEVVRSNTPRLDLSSVHALHTFTQLNHSVLSNLLESQYLVSLSRIYHVLQWRAQYDNP